MPFDDTTTRRERSVALELKLTRAMMDHGVWIQGDYSDDDGGRCLAGWVETGQPEMTDASLGHLASSNATVGTRQNCRSNLMPETTLRTWRLERCGIAIAILAVMGNVAVTGGGILDALWVANAAFAGWMLRGMY